MKGIIGRKVGMTSIFREDGTNVPCTVIEAGPCVVTQIKTEETDGYNAVQLGFEERKEIKTPNPQKGHFKRIGLEPMKHLREFRDFDLDVENGNEVTVEIFEVGERVRVTGTSKGKGFQGVVKRHGFSGVGMRTHGQHNRERAPGAIGMSSDPSRVMKGMRMGGRMGSDRVKVRNLTVEAIVPDKNLILVRGAIPGPKTGLVVIEK